ncbi:NACHT, LRR and PYD domains-containing protein 12 [Entomophthora muscae]|uniref:NACHT, LRR and PYD domains-containing protein 12 n=1 Tax=Entomophthora muscae TaxID=34485 RepID=A0ACC2URT0_9FUNG|nr:NACHT, LRR and PYD domains-containing protein 12 [Entomophthora muscae]
MVPSNWVKKIAPQDGQFLPSYLQTLFDFETPSERNPNNLLPFLKKYHNTSFKRISEPGKKIMTPPNNGLIQSLLFEKDDRLNLLGDYLTIKLASSLSSISFVSVDVLLQDIIVMNEFLALPGCILKSLICVRNNFDSRKIGFLCSGIAKNKSLTYLVLDENGLKNYDVYQLKEALLKRSSGSSCLEMLSLSKNLINDAGVEALSRALNILTLHRLDLSFNNISHYSMLYLKDSVKELFHLDVSFNANFGLRGFNELFEVYYKSSCLTWINLNGLNLGEEIVEDLIQPLKSHLCKIKRLGLSGNRLGDEFGVELAVALAINTSLVELDLSCNLFTNQCIRHLAICLQFNRHLASLHMRQMPETLASSTALVLIRAVRTSARITTLSIELPQEDLAQKLRDSLAENRTLYERVANDACHLMNVSRILLHSVPSHTPQSKNMGDLPFEIMFRILRYFVFQHPPSALSYVQFKAILEYSAQRPSLARPTNRDTISSCRGPRESFLNQVFCLRPNYRPEIPPEESTKGI